MPRRSCLPWHHADIAASAAVQQTDWRTDLAGKLPFFFCMCQVVFSREQKLVEQAEIKKVPDS